MSFTGKESHLIPLEAAVALNKSYRKANPGKVKGYFYSKSTMMEILSQSGCVGIRFYFALDAEGVMKLTFVGVDADENDILDLVGDAGTACPPICGNSNVLNTD